jgi:hypothetical protein
MVLLANNDLCRLGKHFAAEVLRGASERMSRNRIASNFQRPQGFFRAGVP